MNEIQCQFCGRVNVSPDDCGEAVTRCEWCNESLARVAQRRERARKRFELVRALAGGDIENGRGWVPVENIIRRADEILSAMYGEVE